MPTKVLVFESDSAFASELRTEFGALGCQTIVVDDGNLGLQQAAADKPDLILLSIELPRMNGFSVCNKLKKDPGLKDIPLIIMSSESSDETFEQHKKLRTRAEDYVHKPVAFGELLQHVQSFVAMGALPADGEGVIVIDDEIEVSNDEYVVEEDDGAETAVVKPATLAEARAAATHGGDFDSAAETAFGRLTGSDPHTAVASEPARAHPPPPPPPPRAAAAAPPPGRASVPPPAGARGMSLRPVASPVGLDLVEQERMREDLTQARERLATADLDLDESRREIEKLRIEVGEAERLAREVDELKAKVASGAKSGGISSRDFLDLREALNRKDKEILALKEQLSKKDKEIVESHDRALVFERGKADIDDRMLSMERELDEAKEKNAALSTDKDLAKKASEDLRARLEKAKSDGEGRDKQLAELRAKQADERVASEAKLAAARSELDQELANERAAQARALDDAESRHTAAVEQANREHDASIAEVRAQAEQAQTARKEIEEREQNALAALRADHAERLVAFGNDRDSQIAAIEAKASRELAESNDHLAKLEMDIAAVRGELQSLRESKEAGDAAAQTRMAEFEAQRAEAQKAHIELGERCTTAIGRVRELEAELAGVRDELTQTAQKARAEASLAEKASTKWAADKQSLERAKDALAVALTQIEEAEARE